MATKYPSLKNEFAELITSVKNNPTTGTFIGSNCYKIRLGIASKQKGKSGGARVISYVYVESEAVYLLKIYDKSEKTDLTPSELRDMISSLNF